MSYTVHINDYESEPPEPWRHPSWPYPEGTNEHLFKDNNNNVYLYNPNNEKYIMIGTYFFSTDSIVFNEKYKKYILNR